MATYCAPAVVQTICLTYKPVMVNLFIDGVADDATKRIIDGAIVDKPIQVTYISIDEIRFQRDILIAKTDWTQLPDAPLTTAQKAQYKSYRTALRDLPQKYVNMQNIINVDYPQLEDF